MTSIEAYQTLSMSVGTPRELFGTIDYALDAFAKGCTAIARSVNAPDHIVFVDGSPTERLFNFGMAGRMYRSRLFYVLAKLEEGGHSLFDERPVWDVPTRRRVHLWILDAILTSTTEDYFESWKRDIDEQIERILHEESRES